MNSNEKVLKDFDSLVRNLLLRFQQLKKENADLYAMVEQNERDIQKLRGKLEQKDHDYNSLKMAKMIEITDGDLEGAKERVASLIRSVSKCITMLSDEK